MRKTKSYPKVTRKRTSKERAERLNPLEENEEENEQEINREGKGFYACYLLTSLCPRFKGHTYIGFTVNPRRRIRQHNGEIRSGAFRTKKRRPWEMVFCIFGFPTNVSALQFEWAWQHPTESLAVRQAAATFKSFSGVANKIKLAYTMLNLPAWQSLNITVNYFSTKYTEHSAACPSLPEHMKVQVCPVDELPCYTETDESLLEFTDAECVFVDKEDSENTANICGNVEMNMTDIQAHSIGGFSSCYKGGESSSSQDTIEAQQCNKGGNTSGTINETHADTILHIDENSDDEFWFKEYGRRQQTVKNISAENPPTAEVDHALVCSASSLCTAFSMEETNNGAALTSMNKSISDLDWLNGERLRDGTDKDRQAIHSFTSLQEIEVIDLLSPSPGSRIRSNIKKRRIFTGCPEIIDLT